MTSAVSSCDHSLKACRCAKAHALQRTPCQSIIKHSTNVYCPRLCTASERFPSSPAPCMWKWLALSRLLVLRGSGSPETLARPLLATSQRLRRYAGNNPDPCSQSKPGGLKPESKNFIFPETSSGFWSQVSVWSTTMFSTGSNCERWNALSLCPS